MRKTIHHIVRCMLGCDIWKMIIGWWTEFGRFRIYRKGKRIIFCASKPQNTGKAWLEIEMIMKKKIDFESGSVVLSSCKLKYSCEFRVTSWHYAVATDIDHIHSSLRFFFFFQFYFLFSHEVCHSIIWHQFEVTYELVYSSHCW